jgi:2Fe-2S ferredoxin
MAEDESTMLDFTAAPRTEASRQSCQIVLDESRDGLTVDLPKSQY